MMLSASFLLCVGNKYGVDGTCVNKLPIAALAQIGGSGSVCKGIRARHTEWRGTDTG